jgi:subtilisin family serine protease
MSRWFFNAAAVAVAACVVVGGGSAAADSTTELLVRFSPGASSKARAVALAEHGARLVKNLRVPRLVLVRAPAGAAVERALEREPAILYAEPNFVYRLAATPNDPNFGSLWGVQRIAAPAAWDVTTGNGGVIAAVVDTGIDYTHPDLAANVWANPGEQANGIDDDGNGLVDDVRGWNFVDGTNDPTDLNDHGTHVSGTIGARGNNGVGVVGVNWQVSLMALQAADAAGFLTDDAIVNAFQYACSKGARVVNGSFGGPEFSQAMLDVIGSAPCANTLFVFAAGNDSSDNDLIPDYPCDFAAGNLLCVAASDESDLLAGFSNFGAVNVDLAAPGTTILSTIPVADGSYDTFDGTSMATPHVAGAAALLWSRAPSATVADVRSALLLGARRVASLNGLVASGGILDANVALRIMATPIPDTTIVSGPPVATNSTAASFTVQASSGALGGVTFECSLDGAPFASCSSTPSFDRLGEGSHALLARARDGVGRADPTPAAWSWRIDVTPPGTTITARPRARSRSSTARFRFASPDPTARFTCAIGRRSFRPCTSPVWLRRLALGPHTFRVRAVDAVGNIDPTPARVAWRVLGCVVPHLAGKTMVGARRALTKAGCRLGRVGRAYSTTRRGRIVRQKPRPGAHKPPGARVTVVVSRGRR